MLVTASFFFDGIILNKTTKIQYTKEVKGMTYYDYFYGDDTNGIKIFCSQQRMTTTKIALGMSRANA